MTEISENDINSQLNDKNRTIKIVPMPPAYDTTGNRSNAVMWFGNASDADRHTVLTAAGDAARDGNAILVEVDYMLPAVIGYLGRQEYGLYSPTDHVMAGDDVTEVDPGSRSTRGIRTGHVTAVEGHRGWDDRLVVDFGDGNEMCGREEVRPAGYPYNV